MTRTTLWAIRHIPTGHYLPEPPFVNGKRYGGTRCAPASPTDCRVRFFHEERIAQTALTRWLAGRYYTCNCVVPVPGRNAEEMEIVRIGVTLP